jgi:glycosyltransferase involved in cell wall biosynthesis
MHTGGAQTQWAALLGALAERGVPARLLALAERGRMYERLEQEGVDVRFAGMRGRGDLAGLRRALTAAEPRPTLLVTYGVSAQLVGLLMARRASAPLLVTEHTPLLPDGSLLPARRHQRVVTRLVARAVDRVVAVTARQVEPLAELGYRRERIDVIPNGVFAERLRPRVARADTRAALGFSEGDFAVLAPAALRPEKRLELFIDAVAAARATTPDIHGIVAGAGREHEWLEERARRSGAVRLLGARNDLPDLIEAADAVCLSSDAEALPMAALEAMCLGRPVVATDVGGIAEAVIPDETGVLVEPGDVEGLAEALSSLAGDTERARRMGEAGRARQRERFDGHEMVERYIHLFERIGR